MMIKMSMKIKDESNTHWLRLGIYGLLALPITLAGYQTSSYWRNRRKTFVFSRWRIASESRFWELKNRVTSPRVDESWTAWSIFIFAAMWITVWKVFFFSLFIYVFVIATTIQNTRCANQRKLGWSRFFCPKKKGQSRWEFDELKWNF